MRFVLEIDCDNDAFGHHGTTSLTTEVVRLIRDAAHRVELGWGRGETQKLLDANGNSVGYFRFVREKASARAERAGARWWKR